MNIVGAGATDIGLLREKNEDSFAVSCERGWNCFVVCDGLGGANAGEVASRMVTDVFITSWRTGFSGCTESIKDDLRSAVASANRAVFRASSSRGELTGMGTTLVAFVTYAGWGYVVNIGDSRCYSLRKKSLRLLTQDHTLAADMVRRGLLDPDDVANRGERNFLTRVVGTAPEVEADLTSDRLKPGDRYLLCSDGLWGTVPQADLAASLKGDAPVDAARRLVALANRFGGPDNSTAVVVDVLTEP